MLLKNNSVVDGSPLPSRSPNQDGKRSMAGPHTLLLLIGLFLVVAGAMSGCLLNSGGSEQLEPGSRNYRWSVDTLENGPSGWITDIWGSSADNVYAVALGGLHHLWHYDGDSWRPQSPGIYMMGASIYGFGEDDIWVGGDDGELYHYDGQEWSNPYTFKHSNWEAADITSIHGPSSSNIYAVGRAWTGGNIVKSFLLHYDGKTWEKILTTDFPIQFQKVRYGKGNVFVEGYRYVEGATDTVVVYKDDYRQLEELVRMSKDEQGRLSMNNIGRQTYFTVGDELKTYKNGKLVPFAKFPQMEPLLGLYGRTEKDIFLKTWGSLQHYNGNDAVSLLEVPDDMPRTVYRAMLFSREVFFTVDHFDSKKPGITLIYNGEVTSNEE